MEGKPWAVATALTAVPVLKRTNNPNKGPNMGMNISRQMKKLFPKMYWISAPLWLAVFKVWLSSSLICCACSVLTVTKLPAKVTMNATTKTAIIE